MFCSKRLRFKRAGGSSCWRRFANGSTLVPRGLPAAGHGSRTKLRPGRRGRGRLPLLATIRLGLGKRLKKRSAPPRPTKGTGVRATKMPEPVLPHPLWTKIPQNGANIATRAMWRRTESPKAKIASTCHCAGTLAQRGVAGSEGGACSTTTRRKCLQERIEQTKEQ